MEREKEDHLPILSLAGGGKGLSSPTSSPSRVYGSQLCTRDIGSVMHRYAELTLMVHD